jgi:Domain of unknown function (DUF397)
MATAPTQAPATASQCPAIDGVAQAGRPAGLRWRGASCGGGEGVQIAPLDDGAIAVRTQSPSPPVLRFESREWAAFIAAVRAGEFDSLLSEREPDLAAPGLTAAGLSEPNLIEDPHEDAAGASYERHRTLRPSYWEVCERLRTDRAALQRLLKSLDSGKRAALRQCVAERRLVLVRAQMVEISQGDSRPPPGRLPTSYPRQTRGPDTADRYTRVRPRAALAA